ncbi:MAG: prepilin-type N-terminal cleavage/methylation domain-containing protein [Bacillota bacterium]|nr:prepilin-type N-terminal cleavage/methylation domain-containing protein [Bacillota bacterium]
MKSRKKGLTFIELMIAIAIFGVLSVVVVRLNVTANKNMTLQMDKQNMMMVAQTQLEKFKTTKTNIGSYTSEGAPGNSFQNISGYYVVVQSNISDSQGGILYEVTVRVRRDPKDYENEVILKGHVLAN